MKRFDVVDVYLYRHALHDQVQRDHHPQAALLTQDNAGQPGEWARADGNTLADHEVRMRLSSVQVNLGLQNRNGFVLKRFGQATAAYDRKNARRLEDPNPFHPGYADEYIARKQREFQFHVAPVLPLPERSVERQKRFDLPHGEMLEHTL